MLEFPFAVQVETYQGSCIESILQPWRCVIVLRIGFGNLIFVNYSYQTREGVKDLGIYYPFIKYLLYVVFDDFDFVGLSQLIDMPNCLLLYICIRCQVKQVDIIVILLQVQTGTICCVISDQDLADVQ